MNAQVTGDLVRRPEERKLQQLAREVYRVLSNALAELADPRLASAHVVEVRRRRTPASATSCGQLAGLAWDRGPTCRGCSAACPG